VQNPETELAQMWSFVQSKQQQRWIWQAAFLRLKNLLRPFGIQHFYTDAWSAYERHLDSEVHTVGKRYPQKIERKHLTYRTPIKRLARKTICFSKSELMHGTVIGLFINRFEFGLTI
jgi:insertion element IS1 protein InsB